MFRRSSAHLLFIISISFVFAFAGLTGGQALAKTTAQSTITVKVAVKPVVLVQAPDYIILHNGYGTITTTVRSNIMWDLSMCLSNIEAFGRVQYRVDGGSWKDYSGSENFILNSQPHIAGRLITIEIKTTAKVDATLGLTLYGNTSAV